MKLVGRIFLAPFLFIGVLAFITLAIPMPIIFGLIMAYSLMSLCVYLFSFLLAKVGVEIEFEDLQSFFDTTKNLIFNHVLGIFCPITFSFLIIYNFVKNAKIHWDLGE